LGLTRRDGDGDGDPQKAKCVDNVMAKKTLHRHTRDAPRAFCNSRIIIRCALALTGCERVGGAQMGKKEAFAALEEHIELMKVSLVASCQSGLG